MELTLSGSMTVGTAFVISAGLVPALKRAAFRFGLVDNPCHRKRHEGAIPLTGGLAMFIAFLVTVILSAPNLSEYVSLLAGMTVLLLVGIADDILDLRAAFKLLMQVAVASMVVLVGGLELIHLGQLFGPGYGKVGLGPFSSLFTIACMVFMVNVINMSDGVDGLAGGIGVIMLGLLALIGWLDGAAPSLVVACLALSMATAGFLIWNMRFPFRANASAFMGDAGSMVLGFGIAWLAIAIATTDGARVYPISVAWVLLIPCVDTLAVSIRRMKQGKSPMAADRAHMHHILQRCHLSVTATVGVIHLSVICSGLFGIIAWQLGWPQPLIFALAAAVMVGYTTMLLSAHRLIRWSTRRRRG
jgi:UDP-GlcNAc:undecaprenyl-phosphate/decaprenyl-phosphate GlcNAc-1-phosphate transferase